MDTPDLARLAVQDTVYLLDGAEVSADEFYANIAAQQARLSEEDASRAANADRAQAERKAQIAAALSRVNTGRATTTDVEFLAEALA